MNPQKISSKELRIKQAEVLNRIAYGNAHYVITRNGKATAALVSVEEFEILQKAMDEKEEQEDIRDALKTMAKLEREGTKSIGQLAKELGIDVQD